jgi:hypothetical protein
MPPRRLRHAIAVLFAATLLPIVWAGDQRDGTVAIAQEAPATPRVGRKLMPTPIVFELDPPPQPPTPTPESRFQAVAPAFAPTEVPPTAAPTSVPATVSLDPPSSEKTPVALPTPTAGEAPPVVAMVGSGPAVAPVSLAAAARDATDDARCGPPSTTIPGPPPSLIKVGERMSDTWLLCYIRHDLQGQDYRFTGWGDMRSTGFRGYPVECWNVEVNPSLPGLVTPGLVVQVLGLNRDGTQSVRFTYRIQLDGDYINNCRQEIL